MPAFVAGLAEDLTKTMSPRRRLFATALSASLAIWLLDAVIRRTDIPGVDTLIAMVPFAVALTIFAVTGVANSVNIIDGFNGLASMCVLLMLLALAYVAGQAGDHVMQTIAFAGVGAVMWFFVWNFPVARSAGCASPVRSAAGVCFSCRKDRRACRYARSEPLHHPRSKSTPNRVRYAGRGSAFSPASRRV